MTSCNPCHLSGTHFRYFHRQLSERKKVPDISASSESRHLHHHHQIHTTQHHDELREGIFVPHGREYRHVYYSFNSHVISSVADARDREE